MVILMGVVVGLFLWSKFGVKSSTPVKVIEGDKIDEEIEGLSKNRYVDKSGNEVEVVEVLGTVQSWNYETGELKIYVEGKIWKLKIDLSKTKMLVNSLKTKMVELEINDVKSLNWRGGFCEEDHVTAKMKEDDVLFIINNGPRACGFKGE